MKVLKISTPTLMNFYLLAIVLLLTTHTASAQFTITIPKIPKIKKQDQTKPVDNQTTQNTTVTTTSDTQTSESKTTTPSQTNAPPDWWLAAALDDIKKMQDDVNEYTPVSCPHKFGVRRFVYNTSI